MAITGRASNAVLPLRRDPPQSLNERNVPLFSGLPPTGYPSGVIRRYPKNTIVIHDGDSIRSLYFILSGRVKLSKSNQGGKDFTLDIRDPGGYFGDLEFVDSGPCIASVVTLTESWMYIVQNACFERFLSEHPEINQRFYRSLVQRSDQEVRNIASQALQAISAAAATGAGR